MTFSSELSLWNTSLSSFPRMGPNLSDLNFLQVDPRDSNPDLLGLGSVPFDPSRDSTEDSDELLDLESNPLDVDSDPLDADSRDSTEDSDELLDLESDPFDPGTGEDPESESSGRI